MSTSKAVVFVPGLLGSELWHAGKRIWPGSLRSLVFRYPNFPELLSDAVQVGDILGSISVKRLYDALIDDLRLCGFNTEDKSLYCFPYDWRRDIRHTADLLNKKLEQVIDEHSPDVRITLLAHSMGGLVCRDFLESGRFNDRAAHRAVTTLITIGTPHLGTPIALLAAVGRERAAFLSREQVKHLAALPQFPSLYQLLPPAGYPFAWRSELGEQLSPVNIYDPEIAAGLGLSTENLESARLLHAELNGSWPAALESGHRARYFCFAGTHQRMATGLELSVVGDEWNVQPYDADRAGDETVPTWSAAPSPIQGLPVSGSHTTLYKSCDVKRILPQLLNAQPDAGQLLLGPALVGECIEATLRDMVVSPNTKVLGTVRFATSIGSAGSKLRVERLSDGGTLLPAPIALDEYSIPIPESTVQYLNVEFPAPDDPGMYRLAVYQGSMDAPKAADEFFVQADEVDPNARPEH